MSKLIPKHLKGNKLLDEHSKYAILHTYYPIISKYPLTGHSSLMITDTKEGGYKPYYIDKKEENKDYNLVTNNCSDATRCALEKTFNKKIDPFLFTTPGDVLDFALEELNGIPKIKGDSIYYPAEHRYRLDTRPEHMKKLHKGVNTVYIPLNNALRSILKLYIELGNKNKEFKKGGTLIPKKLTGWGKLEYKGPQYSQVIELMKKENPQAYNRLLVANARSLQPNSEIVRWKDAKGKELTSTTNIGMSGTDPIGLLYVEGVALNPVFKGLGRVAEYGLAKAGNKWARARLLSKAIDSKSTTYLNNTPQAYKKLSSKQLPKDLSLLYHQNYGTSKLTDRGLIPGKSNNGEDYLWWKEGSQYGNFPERNVYTIPKHKADIVTRGNSEGINPNGDYPLTKEVPLEELTEYSINPMTYGFEKRIFIVH